ncbi:MAG: leucine-rich repeat domain-containing protein [Treponema sp.]|nr:leucine-rich repeat domain-containing protein [Treponema sp.]
MSIDSAESGLRLSADRTTVISFTPAADSEFVEIPDSVISLPEGLFSGCDTLKKVKLPCFLHVLPDRLFADCTSLMKIIMPAEIYSFGFGTFSGCSSLKSIPFRAGLEELPSEVFSCCSSLSSLIIPDTVRFIRRGAVSGCTALRTVVLPASLEILEKESFTGCSSLRHIRMTEFNEKYRVEETNGCLYEKQDDGKELIVLSPVDYERFEAGMIRGDILSGNKTVDDKAVDGISKAEKKNMQKTQKNISDEASKRASEIVAADTCSIDDTVEPVPEDVIEMLSTESDILSQNTYVNGNPVVLTQNEIDKAESSGEVMRTYDDSYFGPPVKRPEYVPEETILNDPKLIENPMIERIASAAKKYEYIGLKENIDKSIWNDSLYVFAENLVSDESGNTHFSHALVNCCIRIARIQGYTQIRFYYGIPVDNEEFVYLFREFISERSTIYACSVANTAELSEQTVRFCDISGISLERDMLELEKKLAGTKDANILKMILQDDYSA